MLAQRPAPGTGRKDSSAVTGAGRRCVEQCQATPNPHKALYKTPEGITMHDPELCIGCGRCIKICAHDVLAPAEVDEEESAKMFASVSNPEDCIGCEACGRTCKKEAFSFEPLAA